MHWIDVKNKSVTPKEGETYWVTVDFMGGLVFDATWSRNKWHRDGHVVGDVIAWFDFPRPEPFTLPPKQGYEFPEHEVDENGLNKKIKAHILSDKEMEAAGFRFIESVNRWVFFRFVGKDISFNVGINKDDESDFRIDVLDEDFCQPYDYQAIMASDKRHPVASSVFKKVEEYMEKLSDAGIISGHEYGEYI